MRKYKQGKPKPARPKSNLMPVLIMLATVLAVAIPVVWLWASNPVSQYNAHLQKAVRLYTSNRRFGSRVDPGKVAGARREMEAALTIGERAFGPDDPRLEDPLIGLLAEATNDHQARQAKQYGERLLTIQQEKYPSNDRHLVATCENLAQAYRDLGDTAAEEKVLQQKAAMLPGNLGKRDLANFYLRHHQYAKAEPLYEKVVAASLLEVAKLQVAKRQAECNQAMRDAVDILAEYRQLLQALGKQVEGNKVAGLRDRLLRQLKGQAKPGELPFNVKMKSAH